ncbi:MAG TPA: tetratricopeptide repeat protein [Gemmatimonadaceae bacterium]|nr:tetratricopeptide repeat protein [Gemmatimonadaceae bacterium]
MSDAGSPPTLKLRFAAIDARLQGAEASGILEAGERESVKADIIALYKQAEAEIAQLSTFRDEIKGLIERWKQLQQTASPSVAPRFSTARPKPQSDHLGASTFLEKGWNLISLGDHEGAERALLRALELAPDDPQAESLLGWAQMLQEKYDDALLNFQKVLMRQPMNALARINVGYICLKKRIFGEAIEHLSKAIRLDNDRKASLYAHFYLGLVYLEREMFEDAQTFFRKTLALGPNLIEAYYELGRSLWFEGRKDEAIQAWRDGFAANKFNPWGKRCAEMLEHVKDGGAPARVS